MLQCAMIYYTVYYNIIYDTIVYYTQLARGVKEGRVACRVRPKVPPKGVGRAPVRSMSCGTSKTIYVLMLLLSLSLL